MRESKARTYSFITAILLALIIAGVFYVVNQESGSSAPALSAASAIITPTVNLVKSLDGYSGRGFGGVAAIAVIALLTIGLSTKERSVRSIFYATICAVIGQFFLVNRELCALIGRYLGLFATNPIYSPNREEAWLAITCGVFFYCLALILFIRATKREHLDTYDFGRADSARYGGLDAILLLSACAVGLIFRTYALNVIADSFEGELSPYSAGASSLKGMLLANRGTNGPWSPLGILYYLPIFLTTKVFGTTLVALRLSSALVGVLTIPLVYLLAARLSGRIGAILASALFALNCLHIGWSRTDIHPHGVTTWPALLMCWFLIKAYDTKKLAWACGVALMMGLSWHQYPSGQSAVVAPIIAIILFWLTNRRTLPLTRTQTTLVATGLALWAIGLPFSYWLADGRWQFINPFTLTGPRALWGHEGQPLSQFEIFTLVITNALKHLWDVIQGIFYRQPYIFHQEWLPYTDSVLGRTVAWLEVPFSVLGFLIIVRSIKSFESAVMLAWIIAAILPGILSEHAYPKRLSTLFPAIDIVAAIGMASLIHYGITESRSKWRGLIGATAFVSIFATYAAFTSWSWFSGRYWRYGLPAEIAFAERLKESITPGTIVIADLNRSYEAGKYLYLTLDHLADPRNRPNIWLPATTPVVPYLIKNPNLAQAHFSGTMPYLWTKLREQVKETAAHTEWKRVLFVIQEGPEDRSENINNVQLASTRCTTPNISRITRERSALNTLVLIECSFLELGSQGGE
jgi:hypothetical protein